MDEDTVKRQREEEFWLGVQRDVEGRRERYRSELEQRNSTNTQRMRFYSTHTESVVPKKA